MLPDPHPAFLDELRRELFVHLLIPTRTHLRAPALSKSEERLASGWGAQVPG